MVLGHGPLLLLTSLVSRAIQALLQVIVQTGSSDVLFDSSSPRRLNTLRLSFPLALHYILDNIPPLAKASLSHPARTGKQQ